MFAIKNCVTSLNRSVVLCVRMSSAATKFVAVNEPVYSYDPGTPERQALEEKVKEYQGKVHEVPIVIGDEEIRTNDVRYQVEPFDHQKKLTKYYYADKSIIQRAIDESLKVRADWERKPIQERAEILWKAADLISNKYRMDLLAATMLGQGKTIVQAELDAAAEMADFYRFNVMWALELQNTQPISTEESTNKVIYRGLEGFWAAISPFNFTAIGGNLSGSPALMGNVVVWKPSDTAILANYISYKLLREAGVPAGVINFVPADGPVFGDVVLNSPNLAGINFTGSVRTFQHLWKQTAANIDKYRTFPRLIGECGGKNFHFIHSSADVESVVNGTIRSSFEYSGQKCSACSRMYVPESKWGTIKDGLVEEMKKIKLGSPLEGDSFLSAVIDDKSFGRNKGYLEHAKNSANIKVIAGGNCDDSKGYFVEPTVLETTDPKDKIMQEEIFGPVLTVYVYPDADYKQVLKLIDETSPFGLTGAVFAKDPKVAQEAHDILRHAAGNFYINDKSTGSVVAQQPFGGARCSGTNDKAGSPHYLLKFCSPQAIKETKAPLSGWKYSYMG